MKPTLFVGRWQPCHRGHIELWKQGAFNEGRPAVIYVRDIPPDDRNPFTTGQTVDLVWACLEDLAASGEVPRHLITASKVIVGPDIGAVRCGRGVGYVFEQIELPEDIQAISATEIRARIKAGTGQWRHLLTPGVVTLLLHWDWT